MADQPKTKKTHHKILTLESKKTSYIDEDTNWKGDNVFEKLSLVGSGGFGEVWKVRHTFMKFTAAAKIIPISRSSPEAIREEIETFKKMKHPNILGYLGTYSTNDSVWVIMEMCNAGSLKDMIKTLNVPLPEFTVACIVKGVVNGLEALHAANIIHLDIKPANILISDDCEVKLTDFGISKHINDACDDKWYGSAPYMAPEVVAKKPFTPKSDIWSLGITILELREKKPPYEDLSAMRILELIKKHHPPTFKNKEENSDEIRDFVSQCLIKNSKHRASVAQLKKHKFIESVEDNQPIMNLCVSVFQTRHHYLPQIEILPDKKFALKYPDKDVADPRNMVKSYCSPALWYQDSNTPRNESVPNVTSEDVGEYSESLVTERMAAIEKMKADIQTLQEKVLSLQENIALCAKEKAEEKTKEIRNCASLVRSWSKEVVEELVESTVEEKLKELLEENTSGEVSNALSPRMSPTAKSQEDYNTTTPRIDQDSKLSRGKKDTKHNFKLLVTVPKEGVQHTPRLKTTKNTKDDEFLCELPFKGKLNTKKTRSGSVDDRKKPQCPQRLVKSPCDRSPETVGMLRDTRTSDSANKVDNQEIFHQKSDELYNKSAGDKRDDQPVTTSPLVNRSSKGSDTLVPVLCSSTPKLVRPPGKTKQFSKKLAFTPLTASPPIICHSGSISPVIDHRIPMTPRNPRKVLMKQKHITKSLSRMHHAQSGSSARPIEADTEAKILNILRFEVAKAKNAICEMVPSNFEILRTELIDEIDRRTKVQVFNTSINGNITSIIEDINDNISTLSDKLERLQKRLGQIDENLPSMFQQFKCDIVEVLQSI